MAQPTASDPATSTPPIPPTVAGRRPGVLDDSQPSRILRHPDASLSFASFDPLTASFADQGKPSAAAARPKRIVVETLPSGHSTWRFVPKAKFAEGLDDEGDWPRIVLIDSTQYLLDQDQWDIHKIDPAYECVVHPHPAHPTIVRKPDSSASSAPTSPSRVGSQKRPRRSDEYSAGPSTKKSRPIIVVDDDGPADSEAEIVEMMVDPQTPKATAPPTQLPERRKTNRPRSTHNQRPLAPSNSFNNNAPPPAREPSAQFSQPSQSSSRSQHSSPPPMAFKRKVSSPELTPESTAPAEGFKPSKRARTQSPPRAAQHAKSRERTMRHKSKLQELIKEQYRASEEKFQQFERALFGSIPEEQHAPTNPTASETKPDIPAEAEHAQPAPAEDQPHEDPNPTPTPTSNEQAPPNPHQQAPPTANEYSDSDSEDDGGESAHDALLAESRAKLAELERDRPLWETQRHARERRERQEREAERARRQQKLWAEEQRRVQEAREAFARRQRAEQAQRERFHQDRLRAERERIEREQAERGRAQARQQRFGMGAWTPQRALERYTTLCTAFDTGKYAAGSAPLTFDAVPWPVLRAPGTFGAEDIDWSAVEGFFVGVRVHMREQDYRALVEKSHRRFHPDRWSARGLLKAVGDEAERGGIEVAANTVAQALTPLWRETKR
ncbi:hypothetical protein FA95DRAFT_1677189 [Auriscalpium vulgare]|uniref:Uncharacterized protein n=1 Tax=Auriscalpium vulgare TaxID=40419 RepID=A0ACB8S1I4_9AGAM|nr:hypothetical protein FA95DRAFT_1677189 [Auriscalpium vulgare]